MEPKYSVRIVKIDSYMAQPLQPFDVFYSEFRGSSVIQVPVIRIYGTTSTGRKICIHIHGVFPYIYVPVDEDDSVNINATMYQMANSLDKAINTSLNQTSSNMQHIYKISLVSGFPFYGYHGKQHQFLKVYLYNPLLIRRLTNLLQNDNILGKIYQPHEAHLPFNLQFMIDFNLHGMSFINISQLKFRLNNSNSIEGIEPDLYLPAQFKKMSCCDLEADCSAEDILNRLEIAEGNLGVNPGIAALWEDEKQRKRNKNEDSEIGPCLSLSQTNVEPTDSHKIFKSALGQRLALSVSEKEVEKGLNFSVYPVETPSDSLIQNASIIEYHRSLDDTFLDESISQTQQEVTMDEDALKLLDILEDLDQANISKEEDSVLSQNNKEPEEEEELDLSIPFGNITTPVKKILQPEELDADDDLLSPTLIPQVDGSNDDDYIDKKSKRKINISEKKELIIICERNIPLLNKVNSNAKKEKESSTKEIKNRAKILLKLNKPSPLIIRKNKLIKTINIFERKFAALMANKSQPKFKVVPSKQAINYPPTLNSTREPAISDFNITVEVPNEKYLFSYSKNVLSSVTKLKSSSKGIVRGVDEEDCRKRLEKLKERLENHERFLNFDYVMEKGDELVSDSEDLLFVDGANDSDSSEEKPVKRKKLNSPRYSALPIVASPVLPRSGPRSFVDSARKTTSTQPLNKNNKKMDFKVKRKLSFQEEPLSSTIIEERLVCNLRTKPYSETLSKKDTSYNCDCTIKEDIQLSKELNRSEIDLDKTLVNIEESSSDSDLFSNSNSPNTEAYQSNNFSPKPGPSHLLSSLELQQQNNEPISDPSPEFKSSSDSYLTPFQQQQQQCSPVCDKSEIEERLKSVPALIKPQIRAPTKMEVIESLSKLGLPERIYQVPFYSDANDVTGSVEVGLKVLKINSKASVDLPEFESAYSGLENLRKLCLKDIDSDYSKMTKSSLNNLKLSFCKQGEVVLVPAKKPPTREEVQQWLEVKLNQNVKPKERTEPERIKIYLPKSPGEDGDESMNMSSLSLSPCTPRQKSQTPKSSLSSKDNEELNLSPVIDLKSKRETRFSKRLRESLLVSQKNKDNSCRISGVTPQSFNSSVSNLQNARALIEHQLLTLMVMEVHVSTRGDFKPNPQYDPLRAIFYSILNDIPSDSKPQKTSGIIAVRTQNGSKLDLLDGSGLDCDIHYVDCEKSLLEKLLELVHEWDPDILAGYEIELLSWGYLIERSNVLGINLLASLSRTKEKASRFQDDEELNIAGRIVLDVWRLMRHEVALQSYSFENIVFHILHKRVPCYSFKELSFWWEHNSNLFRSRTARYYLYRVNEILVLFDKLDLIGRTSELARLFGIQFYEVLSRGSQFRVESMMLRLAKPLGFIPVSPSVQQRAKMRAPEFLPLILEPESKLYNDPVIVLDFQSLYPSMIIAYNYCFSTCLGRVEHLGKKGPFEFGATQLKVSRKRLEYLLRKDYINFSPCGVAFVKANVRDGILPRMLREILDTRLMVKKSMKENKGDSLLQRVLHNRQLGLKLIANVTYGYTAANFSGRMSCVEIADSVLSKGRETLQRAINLVDSTPEWGARVVYGDTDSLFVLLEGKTKDQAFKIGKEIAEAVTKTNPDPVKLKFEKVYLPCILQTKKRYVGYMYESEDQEEPVFEAKGIETVRRDGCPAVSKVLEKCLRMLFDTKDISAIKKYVLRQFNKILTGRISIQDLTFSKEYRGASGYRPGACVPALELAKKWTAVDSRNEPRRKERVPYVIVNGPPGLPLIRMVRSPRDLLNDPSLRPNAIYYITKVIIPPVNRCFSLIGADLNTWFNQMPRKLYQFLPTSSPGKKSTISQYFSTTSCASCGEQTQGGICQKCLEHPQRTVVCLNEKARMWESNNSCVNLICQTCSGLVDDVKCISLDCPVLYRRVQTNREFQQTVYVRQLLDELF